MNKNEYGRHRREYRIDVYNKYVDISFAHADLDQFDIQELLFHQNPRVREFSLIIISKKRGNDDINTRPVIAIYNRNIWKHRLYFTKERPTFHKINFHTEYSCVHHVERFDNEYLINIPCDSQEDIISRFNSISKLLINKGIIKKENY